VAAQDVLGQVDGETVGVVELEHDLSGEALSLLLAELRHLVFEQAQAATEGAEEALFLPPDRVFDEGAPLHELGVGPAHLFDDDTRDVEEKRLFHPEEHSVTRRAAQHATQNVAPALVRREDAVPDQERTGARVIGHDADRGVLLIVAPHPIAGDRLRSLDQRGKEVGVVVARASLQDHGEALQAQTRIDRRLGERDPGSVCGLVELHEDEVPELVKPLLRGVGPGLERLAVRDQVDLGAGPTRSGVAHLPEVLLLAEPEDPALGKPDLLVPNRVRVVVTLENRDDEPIRVQPVPVRQEVPCEVDRLGLEVVSEREVAEHLEEGVVSRALADVIEIIVLSRDPHALLRAGRSAVVPRLLPQEDPLELDHSGVREHERRIPIRNQRRRRHGPMIPLLEVAQEGLADLVSGHGDGRIPEPRPIDERGAEGPGQGEGRRAAAG
jgi:hypothetical protein